MEKIDKYFKNDKIPLEKRGIMKKELKVLLFLIISLIVFTPNIVLANIRCNDGTYSSTCTSNHSGCCSHHGGVASSSYSSSNSSYSSSSSYSSYNKIIKSDFNEIIGTILVWGFVAFSIFLELLSAGDKRK